MKNRIFTSFRIEDNFPKILVATIIFYFYKTAFWPLTYLFVLSYAVLVILFLIRFDWKFRVSGIFSDFMSPLILAGIFILVFLLNGHFSNAVATKDILLISVLFSLFYFLYWNNISLNRSIPKSFTFNLIIVTTAVISVLNLLSQFNISILPTGLISKLHLSYETAIANDYNFFSLFILFSLVILNFKGRKNVHAFIFPKLATVSLNIILIVNIVLSSSRRGIIILVLLISIYFIYSIVLGAKGFSLKKLLKKTVAFFIIIFILFIIGVIVYQKVPIQKLSIVAYKYATLVGINDFKSIEKLLWEKEPGVPKDPNFLIDKYSITENYKNWYGYSTLGTILSKYETPYGAGIKVSRGSGDNAGFSLQYIGPKIIYYANHIYKISFKIKFITGDFNSFNVGWWGDDGGKGFANVFALDKETEAIGDDWYICTSKYMFIDNHFGLIGFINSVADNTSFIISDFELIDMNYNPNLPRYLFELTGKEDLIIRQNEVNSSGNDLNLINNGDFKLGLAFWRHTSDSLTVKITNIDGKKCAFISRSNGDGGNWSLYYVGRNIEYKANCEYQIAFKMKPISPKTIPFKVGFWVDEGEGYQIGLKLKIDTIEDGWLDIKAKYIFKKNHTNLLFPINSQIDNSQFYITDISLVNLTQTQFQLDPGKFTTDTIKKEALFSDRTSRWSYAIELWNGDYKWYNKLFGHGFDYLEWYGKKFIPNNTGKSYDWPHNPFISVLLYSGIIGFIAYLWLLWKVISLYIIYRKDYAIAFIGFLITFFFSFFSGSSPFDPPIMGFFMLLPFFIHSIHKNEPPKLTATLTDEKNSNNRD